MSQAPLLHTVPESCFWPGPKRSGTIEQNLPYLEIHQELSNIKIEYESTSLLIYAYHNPTKPNLTTLSGAMVAELVVGEVDDERASYR